LFCRMLYTQQEIAEFQTVVWEYYRHHGRDLPWRVPEADGNFDPYKTMVSEIMLQQTQVSRVIPKYQQFLDHFPTVEQLAQANLGEVLKIWSGLGYNRRAKFLHQAAQILTREANPEFPQTLNTLSKLPGIGKNTAAAILVYGFNQPVPFIETNIRTVFINYFYHDSDLVSDKLLLPLVEDAIDHENPREWFWALMDYGSYLKSSVGNISRQSKHYVKQSKFEGSARQIRGQVLRLLAAKAQTPSDLAIEITDQRLPGVLQALEKEQLIIRKNSHYQLP
jgi:A/G-specific adenine glycosylase